MNEESDKNFDTQKQAWQRIEEHFKSGKPLAMQVVEATQHRWIVEFEGVRGIVEGPYVYGYTINTNEQPITPEEQIKRILENSLGKSMLFKVVEADHKLNHLILSQKLYTDEEQVAMRTRQEQTTRELRPGDVRQGIVTSVNKTSINVEIDGVRGWMPRGLFAHNLATDARTVVHVGQEIEVMVLENNKGKLLLSLIHAQGRDEVLQTIRIGQSLTKRIVSLSSEGVYVDLDGPIGFISADQITHGYITHPADMFHSGQEVVVKVTHIDNNKNVILSLIEAH